MDLYTYQNWQILIIPYRRGWTFRVRASDSEGEPLSDFCFYKSPDQALHHARQYIDFQLDCQNVRQSIMTNLDTLLEQDDIDTGLYVWAVRFLRDGLGFDRTKPS